MLELDRDAQGHLNLPSRCGPLFAESGERYWSGASAVGQAMVVCVLIVSRLLALPGTPWGLALSSQVTVNVCVRRFSQPQKWQIATVDCGIRGFPKAWLRLVGTCAEEWPQQNQNHHYHESSKGP